MGKSKKAKNVDQEQRTRSETKDCRIENSIDFLTSDDFCIVQKKKNSRKQIDDGNILPKLKSSSNLNTEDEPLSVESEVLDYSTGTASIQDSLETLRPLNCFQHCEDDSNNHERNEIITHPDTSFENIDEFHFSKEGRIKRRPKCLEDAHGDSSAFMENNAFSELNLFQKEYCDTKFEKISGFVAAKNGFELLSDNDFSNEDISDEVPDHGKAVKSSCKTDGNNLGSESDDKDIKIVRKKKKKEPRKKHLDKELEQIIEQLNSCKAENVIDIPHESNLQNNMKMDFDANAGLLKCDVNVNNCEGGKATNKVRKDCNVVRIGQEAKYVSDLTGENVKNISETLNDEGIQHTENTDVVQNKNCSEQHTLKTAAQKKKEKKEREKLKRLERYVAESSKKPSDTIIKNLVQSETNEFSHNVHVSEEKEENLKSTKIYEQEKKDRKKPGKKQLALIQEALKKAKEEEERLRKEEEARQKAAEEAERLRQEKLRQEMEKREKKKIKEKQRRERMKAEGRLLSKSQKQSRARMEATLAALREQGIDVPRIGEKKPHGPRLGNYRTSNRRRLDSNQSTQSSDGQVSVSERHKSESLSSQESSGKESLIDFPNSFDSKDSWDVSSIEAFTAESETGHFSCSEESDILDENSSGNLSPAKEALNSKLNLSLEKSNLKKVSYPLPTDTKSSPLENENKKNDVKLRSPVVCVLGHVDTGKTKILDYIRKTHIQDAEAGGITQQIGATMIPQDALKDKCKMVKEFPSLEMKIPGLLVIDTPGHESFSNLRSRGSSVCDIGVLVVDIMHGLEPQTIESINLLRKRKIPFIVALNKIDRIYGWKSAKDEDIEKTVNSQSQITLMEFKKRCQDIILQFAKECLNAALFYENSDPRTFVSMVPTSAISGDGMGNILALLTQLTQSLMHKKLVFSDELQATVLEVKAIAGLGTTIDVILVNGCLHEGDTIVLAGHDGPNVTQIRSLLMPQPLKELRVKNPYIEYKKVEGAQGIKVTGKDLDRAIAGLPLFVAQSPNKVDNLKEEIMHLFRETMNSIKTSERGVYVQASTLGSLEALLEFLNTSGIPYFGIKIGPVVKKDVMKASIMLEHDSRYAVILAFDVKIEKDAQELADSLGVRIFHADIIYHLFDMYVKYSEDLLLKRREEIKRLAVFPCKLKILPEFIFSVRDPIILGVSVEAGMLKEGTPLCLPSKENLEIGTVTSIEVNHKALSSAKKGQEVCIKIEPKPGESPKMYGRHFDHDDLLVSRISRCSIDICKEHFRDEFQASDWHLMVELKKLLHIV